MSDPLDAALRGLRGQRPPAPFAAPEAVRRRGRQRTTHQAMAAGIAVLAVVGGTAGWLSGYERGAGPINPPGATTPPPTSTPPSASTSPSRTASPTPITSLNPTAPPFLQAADLGAGNWRRLTDSEIFNGGRSYWWPPLCPIDRENQHPSASGTNITLFNGVTFRDGGVGQPVDNIVTHVIEIYVPGKTDTRLDEIRAALARCNRTTAWNDQQRSAPKTFQVTELSGIGDEAFLVRTGQYSYDPELSRTPTSFTLDVVVRIDNVVTTIHTSKVDDDFARKLAIKATERLR